MKFRIQVEPVDGLLDPHWEEYDEDTDDALQWADDIVTWFNDTCLPGDIHRRLLSVEIL